MNTKRKVTVIKQSSKNDHIKKILSISSNQSSYPGPTSSKEDVFKMPKRPKTAAKIIVPDDNEDDPVVKRMRKERNFQNVTTKYIENCPEGTNSKKSSSDTIQSSILCTSESRDDESSDVLIIDVSEEEIADILDDNMTEEWGDHLINTYLEKTDPPQTDEKLESMPLCLITEQLENVENTQVAENLEETKNIKEAKNIEEAKQSDKECSEISLSESTSDEALSDVFDLATDEEFPESSNESSVNRDNLHDRLVNSYLDSLEGKNFTPDFNEYIIKSLKNLPKPSAPNKKEDEDDEN